MTIGSIFTSPAVYGVTQNTAAQVGIETGLKAIGRPGFIVLDNNIDSQTKKYSAMKELLFQLTCLVVSLGVVVPVFKKGSFNIGRKLYKDEAVFKAFETWEEFKAYRSLSEEQKLEKLAEINKNSKTDYKPEDINEHLGKGMIEVSSIVGSMLGLSALSPMISRPFVRPVLKLCGFEKGEGQPASEKEEKKSVDTVA